MNENKPGNLKAFLEIMGNAEEPIGMYYTDHQPPEGFAPFASSSRFPILQAMNSRSW